MAGRVIVITGPTATGKTRLGAMLARALNSAVVGADSMQIYRQMDIGTAKPTADEMLGVPHYMIDIVPPTDNYSVSRYVADASAICDRLLSEGKTPIIVGGTGLYIESLLLGREFAEEGVSSGLRDELSAEYDAIGGEAMLNRLADFDPASAARLHANDKKRIVRAFEVYRSTGRTMTEYNDASKTVPPRYEALKIALSFEGRQDLYARIDRRVDRMAADGLVEEVRALLDSGIDQSCTAMQAIGYKELTDALLNGGSTDEALELIRRRSRQYAKRQLSWLRRDPSLHWLLWNREPDPETGLQRILTWTEAFTNPL